MRHVCLICHFTRDVTVRGFNKYSFLAGIAAAAAAAAAAGKEESEPSCLSLVALAMSMYRLG